MRGPSSRPRHHRPPSPPPPSPGDREDRQPLLVELAEFLQRPADREAAVGPTVIEEFVEAYMFLRSPADREFVEAHLRPVLRKHSCRVVRAVMLAVIEHSRVRPGRAVSPAVRPGRAASPAVRPGRAASPEPSTERNGAAAASHVSNTVDAAPWCDPENPAHALAMMRFEPVHPMMRYEPVPLSPYIPLPSDAE